MSNQKLLEARQLIKAKRYVEAANILETLPDEPQAQQWLNQMVKKGWIVPIIQNDNFAIHTIESPEPYPIQALPRHQAGDSFPQPKPELKQLSITECVALGAIFAATGAAVWVFDYLTSAAIWSTQLLEYVTGDMIGSSAFESTEALFAVVSRFLLGFGGCWGPWVLLLFFVLAPLDKKIRTWSRKKL